MELCGIEPAGQPVGALSAGTGGGGGVAGRGVRGERFGAGEERAGNPESRRSVCGAGRAHAGGTAGLYLQGWGGGRGERGPGDGGADPEQRVDRAAGEIGRGRGGDRTARG